MIASLALIALVQGGSVTDSLLSFADFQREVARTHPVVQAADLSVRRASLGISLARGAFDPTVSAIVEQKRFKGIGYYDEVELRALFPTPFGVDFKLGWERADGEIINPERATPLTGLLSASVVVPLGRRILTDERRTALTQASAALEAAEADRTQAVLGLLNASARAFGVWYEASTRARIAREAEALAAFRLTAVQSRIATGDAAAIDSIEARLELRARRIARLEATNDAIAAQAQAAVFWGDRPLAGAVAPLLVPEETVPPPDATVDARLAAWVETHPIVRRAGARLRDLRAGRSLARQNLLPDAKVELGALNAGRSSSDLFALGATDENYKVSGTASQSLFLAKERARLGIADVGVDISEWELMLARRQVEAGIRIAAAEWRTLAETRALQAESVADARALLDGELRRFAAGETSLLVVNLRERALITEQNTLARLDGRIVAAAAAFTQATGGAR
jgi:outer membrane protein TolC